MGPSLVEQRRRDHAARNGVLISLAGAVVVLVLIWIIAMFSREVIAPSAVLTAHRPVPPVGAPAPQTLASVVPEASEPSLRLQVPIRRNAITAIGYSHRNDDHALELEPSGNRGNEAWGARWFRRFLATQAPSDLRWFALGRSGEPPTMVTVGAAVGTDVYAPLNGTVIAVSPYVIDGSVAGQVVQIQPLGDADTVIVMRDIDAAAGLSVGQGVSASSTLVGTVRDMPDGLERPLARYTHDSGPAVELYVRRVSTPRASGV